MHCCENRTETKNTGAHIDPVCGMELETVNMKLVADYNGRKYYFCAEDCMKEFNRHPDRCLDAKPTPGSKKKGLWGRYLERLNKATGGKPIKCH